jgi:hypothetical protein
MSAVLDTILYIGARERLLLDKESEIGGPGITPEEAVEIDELRKAPAVGGRERSVSGQ